MPLDQVENFVEVNVAGDHNSTETTISLESGEASNLPDPSSGEFNLVWFDSTNFSRPSEDNNVEIVRVTGRDTTNDTITVLRGQENTTAVSHDTANSDYVMILAQTAKMIEDVDAADFSTNSLTVAGNSVTLGSSTEVDYIDLNNTGNSFPIPNADLSNSSVSIAGNNVALGGSTNINYVDLNDTGTSFPIPNSDLGNSSLTVAGNNVVLGGSTSVNHSDISNIDADDHHTRYSDEEAQDAVGTILNADFNYDDGGNSITLASNSLTVGNTTISLGGSGSPEVDNLGGGNGTSGQFLQTDGNNLTFADVSSFSGDYNDLENVPTLPEGVTSADIFENDLTLVRSLAEVRANASLSEDNFDAVFFDIFIDQSKIASSSGVKIKTGSITNSNIRAGLASDASFNQYDDHADSSLDTSKFSSEDRGQDDDFSEVDAGEDDRGLFIEGFSTGGAGNTTKFRAGDQFLIIEQAALEARFTVTNSSDWLVETATTNASADAVLDAYIENPSTGNSGVVNIYDASGFNAGITTAVDSNDVSNGDTFTIRHSDGTTWEVLKNGSQLSSADVGVESTANTQVGLKGSVNAFADEGDNAEGNLNVFFGNTEVKPANFTNSASVKSTTKNLGFTPSKVLARVEGDIPSGTDVSVKVEDSSGNNVSIPESDIGSEVDASNLQNGDVTVETTIQPTDTQTPVIDAVLVEFV